MRYPGISLTTQHYLTHDGRTLNIGFVQDVDNIGQEFEIICGEDV
jgi:head-tail adaptor